MKPAPLHPTDTVGIIAPGSAPEKPEALQKGIKNLKATGLTVKPGFAPYRARGYLSGTDEERLREFNHQLVHPEIRALFCARGGYGCLRLLPMLDFDLAREHTKLLIGYSDITALQLALYKHAGWTSLAGPMVAPDWASPDLPSIKHFWSLAGGSLTDEAWSGPRGEELTPHQEGSVEGVLLGGNFSVVCRLIGTRYLPDLTGAILFLEDVDEPPYRVDSMFAHLQHAGVLDEIGGLLIGDFSWCEKNDKPSLSYTEVLNDYVAHLDIPVATNLIYGHIPSKNTMPIGVRAKLHVAGGAANLTLLESVCIR